MRFAASVGVLEGPVSLRPMMLTSLRSEATLLNILSLSSGGMPCKEALGGISAMGLVLYDGSSLQ
jgi:hypothetical protein